MISNQILYSKVIRKDQTISYLPAKHHVPRDLKTSNEKVKLDLLHIWHH